jgi:single-strand DNA-binding protein
MINKVILLGNLGKDPEIKHLDKGSMVANFTVATNENYRDKDDQWQTVTEWHNIVAWRNLANLVEKNLKKGSLVYIEGKLRTSKYQTKEGIERTKTDIEAIIVKPLDRQRMDEHTHSSNSGQNISAPPPAANDDLPF